MDAVKGGKALTLSGATLAVVSVVFTALDAIYRIVTGISFANRDSCFLYQSLPRAAFIVFENFVELTLSVYLGTFIAVLLEKHLIRVIRFVPKNPLTAFLYGSVLPSCSCSAIPMIQTMRGSMNMRTIITFVIAAPLLNPYIITMSFLILGPFYGTARIVGSFVLAVSAGYVIGFLSRQTAAVSALVPLRCGERSCQVADDGVFSRTMRLFLSVLPFLSIGALVSIALDYRIPDKYLAIAGIVNDTLPGNLAVIGLGIPLYLCNGADLFILRPLMQEAGLSTGTAIEFSLTSSAICLTSILMLIKVLGKRLTAALILHIALVVLALGYVVNLIGRLINAT